MSLTRPSTDFPHSRLRKFYLVCTQYFYLHHYLIVFVAPNTLLSQKGLPVEVSNRIENAKGIAVAGNSKQKKRNTVGIRRRTHHQPSTNLQFLSHVRLQCNINQYSYSVTSRTSLMHFDGDPARMLQRCELSQELSRRGGRWKTVTKSRRTGEETSNRAHRDEMA